MLPASNTASDQRDPVEYRDILIYNLTFICTYTTNVMGLHKALAGEGIIPGPTDTDLLDYIIYKIVSLIINHPGENTYETFLRCLEATQNEKVSRRLRNTVLPAKKIISDPEGNVDARTPIRKDDILELTDILSDPVIPYEEFDNFLYKQHIEPEKSYHRKFTQKTDKSEHWRLRKTLKLWVSTYPWLATFEVLINQLKRRKYASVADKVTTMLTEVKKEIVNGESGYAGSNRRWGIYYTLPLDADFQEAGDVLRDYIKRNTENESERNTGKPLRRCKIVQFALSLSKVKRHEKLDKLSGTYSCLSLFFKILAITATLLDVFFDFKFIYDCYESGETKWCIISSLHLLLSALFFRILAYRYCKKSQNIREHLGLLIENQKAGIREVDDDVDSLQGNGETMINMGTTSLDTVNNAADLSFPNPKSCMFRVITWCPIFWACPSAILNFYWIWTYLKLRRHRRPNHAYSYSKDKVLTIYGELICLFCDSSHAGKMARYEYFVETLPQQIIQTIYFLNVWMRTGAVEGYGAILWACSGVAIKLLFLAVPLTLFEVTRLQYRHFEDQRMFHLEFSWEIQAHWMLSSGLSTMSIVLATSVFFEFLFDNLFLNEWFLIFLAVLSYLVTFLVIRRPSFHPKSFKTTLRRMFSIASKVLSSVHVNPKTVSDQFLQRSAFLLILLLVSLLTGPNVEEDKCWSNLLLTLSLFMYILSGFLWIEHDTTIRSANGKDKQKLN